MLRFDFNDDSPERFETARSPQQPNPLDETPTFPEPTSHEQSETKPERGLKRRMVQEGLQTFAAMTAQDLADYLNQQAEADDLEVRFTAQDVSSIKSQLKRRVAPALEKGRTTTASSVRKVSDDAALKQAVDLVKKLGTGKVRELCDLIDCVSQ